MFDQVETSLLALAQSLPLELFVLIGSIVEEVIAPVPALAVMLVAGSAAAVQGLTVLDLIPLAIIAALGKALGAIVVYMISASMGTLVLTKYGRYFRVSAEEIHDLGKHLKGTKRDYVFLTVLRALPIIPSSVVSLGCGLLKIPFKLFLITTFIGTIVRDGIFLYVGYSGVGVLKDFANKATDIESVLQTGFIVLVLITFAYIYYRRKKNRPLLDDM